jgi:hypothetical protein
MAEKEESGFKLDALLDRIPIVDGGGRRRLTAGTVVVLTVVLVFPEVRDAIRNSVATEDVSISLVLAGGALLIYATGVIVELVGEVFLARAIANAAWSYVEAAHRARKLRPWQRPIGWLFVAVWGTFRAVGYFVLGLFGASRWRMQPLRRLSGTARGTFEMQPFSVRNSIEQALGHNAEFGRKALIDQLATTESRRWARRLMDRPRDVLALVSAIVSSLILYLAVTPITYRVSPGTMAELIRNRWYVHRMMDPATWELRAGLLAAPMEKVPPPLAARVRHAETGLQSLLHHLDDMTYPSHLVDLSDEWISGSAKPCDSLQSSFEIEDLVARLKSEPADPEARHEFDTALAKLCEKVRVVAYVTGNTALAAHDEIRATITRGYVLRTAFVLGALFLYMAFFNTLTAVTVSVMEALALERPKPAIAPIDASAVSSTPVEPAPPL